MLHFGRRNEDRDTGRRQAAESTACALEQSTDSGFAHLETRTRQCLSVLDKSIDSGETTKNHAGLCAGSWSALASITHDWALANLCLFNRHGYLADIEG
jgi:hypothetical protein